MVETSRQVVLLTCRMVEYAALDAYCTRAVYISLQTYKQRLADGSARVQPPPRVPPATIDAQLQQMLASGDVQRAADTTAEAATTDGANAHVDTPGQDWGDQGAAGAAGAEAVDDARTRHRRGKRRPGRSGSGGGRADSSAHAQQDPPSAPWHANESGASDGTPSAQPPVAHTPPAHAAQTDAAQAGRRGAARAATRLAPTWATLAAQGRSTPTSGVATRNSGSAFAAFSSSVDPSPLNDPVASAPAAPQRVRARPLAFPSMVEMAAAAKQCAEEAMAAAQLPTVGKAPDARELGGSAQKGQVAELAPFCNDSARHRSCSHAESTTHERLAPGEECLASTQQRADAAAQAAWPAMVAQSTAATADAQPADAIVHEPQPRWRRRGGRNRRGPPAPLAPVPVVFDADATRIDYGRRADLPDARLRPTELYVRHERAAHAHWQAQVAHTLRATTLQEVAQQRGSLSKDKRRLETPLAQRISEPEASVWDAVEWYFHSVEQVASGVHRGADGEADAEAAWVTAWGIEPFKRSRTYAELIEQYEGS